MTFKRIIASLLLDQKKKLVKGKQFKDHKIVGVSQKPIVNL